MTDKITTIGWVDAYVSTCPESKFTRYKKEALVARIKKRGYDFTHNDHQFLSYCCPYYNDGTKCILTKAEWDGVMEEAWANRPRTQRIIPQDVLGDELIKGEVLFEKAKFIEGANS